MDLTKATQGFAWALVLGCLAGCPPESDGGDRQTDAGASDGATPNMDTERDGASGDSAPNDAGAENEPAEQELIPYGGAGSCDAPEVEELYKHDAILHGIAVLDGTLYFTGNNGFFSMPSDGSAEPTLLEEKSNSFSDLSTLGDDVLVSHFGNTVMRWRDQKLTDLNAGGNNFSTHGGTAFTWSSICDHDADEINAETSRAAKAFYTPTCIQGFTATERNFYWLDMDFDINDGDDAQLRRRLRGTEEDVAIGERATYVKNSVIAVGEELFAMIARSSSLIEDEEELAKIDESTGVITRVAGPLLTASISADGDDLFIANERSPSCIYRWDGSKLVAVGRGVGLTQQLAFDETYVYVATYGGSVGRALRR